MSTWMVEDALDGRLSKGKSRDGDPGVLYPLRLSGRTIYHLQQFLEEEYAKGGDPFRVRAVVLLAEEIREAVASARQEQEVMLRGGHPLGGTP